MLLVREAASCIGLHIETSSSDQPYIFGVNAFTLSSCEAKHLFLKEDVEEYMYST